MPVLTDSPKAPMITLPVMNLVIQWSDGRFYMMNLTPIQTPMMAPPRPQMMQMQTP